MWRITGRKARGEPPAAAAQLSLFGGVRPIADEQCMNFFFFNLGPISQAKIEQTNWSNDVGMQTRKVKVARKVAK